MEYYHWDTKFTNIEYLYTVSAKTHTRESLPLQACLAPVQN